MSASEEPSAVGNDQILARREVSRRARLAAVAVVAFGVVAIALGWRWATVSTRDERAIAGSRQAVAPLPPAEAAVEATILEIRSMPPAPPAADVAVAPPAATPPAATPPAATPPAALPPAAPSSQGPVRAKRPPRPGPSVRAATPPSPSRAETAKPEVAPARPEPAAVEPTRPEPPAKPETQRTPLEINPYLYK
jgi:type IV secretory pathway VirB10-like protein